MRLLLTVLTILLIMGCSSSKEVHVPSEGSNPSPLTGAWILEDTGDVIHFLSTGNVTIEPGKILAAINRLQNTQRRRYTSHLLGKGTYETTDNNELILHIEADWTGKGRGARRPSDKRVRSKIVFEYSIVNNSILTLRKKLLTQDSEENLNAEEELQFTLIFVE